MSAEEPHVHDLAVLAAGLVEAARSSPAQRAAKTLHGGHESLLRQTVIALLAGAELAPHESPPEATVQVLSGRIRLTAVDRSWEQAAGTILTIPSERHSVAALTDSVFILTAIRAVAPGDG